MPCVVRRAFPVHCKRGKGIPGIINGEQFRIDPKQRHRFWNVYEPELTEILRSPVRTGGPPVDVGANVGVYAMPLANIVGPTVMALEPNCVASVEM